MVAQNIKNKTDNNWERIGITFSSLMMECFQDSDTSNIMEGILGQIKIHVERTDRILEKVWGMWIIKI